MRKKKLNTHPVLGANKYNPYMPSNPNAGIREPMRPKPIKLLAAEIKPSKWVSIIIVSFIPIINIIAFLAWSNKNNYGANPNIKTYSKACLIIYSIVYVLLGVAAVLLKFVFHLF